ncbi:hypothetical protein HQ603_17930, partial [Rhodococcus corynebacterioides]|nr:hypothetical protein [Rhodococcus corynebacterioides]
MKLSLRSRRVVVGAALAGGLALGITGTALADGPGEAPPAPTTTGQAPSAEQAPGTDQP